MVELLLVTCGSTTYVMCGRARRNGATEKWPLPVMAANNCSGAAGVSEVDRGGVGPSALLKELTFHVPLSQTSETTSVRHDCWAGPSSIFRRCPRTRP